MERLQEMHAFGGRQQVYRHRSESTKCEMEFAIFDPDPENTEPKPALLYLSGLTCTWANVAEKAGAQRYASEHGLILVMPDTSPRGLQLPGEDDDYDFGSGAGFYINATRSPWDQNYQMFDYVTEELPKLMTQVLGCDSKRLGITGHSMGGHGALISALKRPDVFRSCSAFAPISNPINCPWGQKAFTGYLGTDQALWREWDACELATSSNVSGPIRVDQGEADNFREEQLKPDALATAFNKAGLSLIVRKQPNYDHSYYFISSFIGEHVAHHARELR